MRRRRDRGNELVVAIAVTGILVVALAFAIILTLSNNAEDDKDEKTPAHTEEVAVLPQVTEEMTTTPAAPATATATENATEIAPEVATATATEESTEDGTGIAAVNTRESPVKTAEVAPVITEEASAEPTLTPTIQATETIIKPTEIIPTKTATPTVRATNTPKPTRTPQPTITPSPTRTNTATRTSTNTPKPTNSPSPTPTVPKATLTFTPYPSLTPSITPFGGERTNTPSASGCKVPEGWVPYTIQRGDTLYALALRFGISAPELADANCITDIQSITAGLILFAPPGSDVTPPAPATRMPEGGTAPPQPIAYDCGDPAAMITQPSAGTILQGTIAIYGSAMGPNFQFYRLQISGGETPASEFVTLNDIYTTPVEGGQLGIVNTAAFAPGDYWLRLTVVDVTGNYPPQCTIRVRFAP